MSSSTTADCSCRITLDFDQLRKTELFAGAPAEVVKLFAYFARHRHYPAGNRIIIQGEKAEKCYLLLSGEVEISTRHRDKEIVVQRLTAGSFFGELALLARFDWFFSSSVKLDAEVIEISREAFQKVLSRYPEKRDKIIEKVVQLRISRFENQTSHMLDRLTAAGIQAGNTDAPLID